MGTLFDLNKNSTHDYVDNPFWSIFQIRVKTLLHDIYITKSFGKLKEVDNNRKMSTEEE